MGRKLRRTGPGLAGPRPPRSPASESRSPSLGPGSPAAVGPVRSSQRSRDRRVCPRLHRPGPSIDAALPRRCPGPSRSARWACRANVRARRLDDELRGLRCGMADSSPKRATPQNRCRETAYSQCGDVAGTDARGAEPLHPTDRLPAKLGERHLGTRGIHTARLGSIGLAAALYAHERDGRSAPALLSVMMFSSSLRLPVRLSGRRKSCCRPARCRPPTARRSGHPRPRTCPAWRSSTSCRALR